MITGGRLSASVSRSSTPQPSSTGIITSHSTRSGALSAMRASASRPFLARITSWPSSSRLIWSISRMSGSSSTSSRRATVVPLPDRPRLEPELAAPRHDLADADGTVAVGAQHVDGLEGGARRHGDHHPDPEVEHPEHLVVADLAETLDLAEDPG